MTLTSREKISVTYFGFSVKFKVVLMVFVTVCHTLDNDHVKGNFILFAMSVKVMVISRGGHFLKIG